MTKVTTAFFYRYGVAVLQGHVTAFWPYIRSFSHLVSIFRESNKFENRFKLRFPSNYIYKIQGITDDCWICPSQNHMRACKLQLEVSKCQVKWNCVSVTVVPCHQRVVYLDSSWILLRSFVSYHKNSSHQWACDSVDSVIWYNVVVKNRTVMCTLISDESDRFMGSESRNLSFLVSLKYLWSPWVEQHR